jgi:catechol 2,3-dioxygenase-like lactoylglutathione lyase family enzyme
VRRIIAYAGGNKRAASRDFYVEVLGMQVTMEDPVLDLQSPDHPLVANPEVREWVGATSTDPSAACRCRA